MDARFIRWITVCAASLGLVGTLACLFVGVRVALGCGLGALLAVLNLWLLGRLGARLVDNDDHSRAKLTGLFLLKFTLFIGVVLGMTIWLPVPPLAFMGGLSVVILAILLGTLFGPSPARAS